MADKKSNKRFQNDVLANQGDLWFFLTEYRGSNKSITAVCKAAGHRVSRNAQLFYYHKCPECSYNTRGRLKRNTSLSQLKSIVKEKGGTLREANFKNGIWHTEITCAAGHIFTPSLSSIKHGSWCPRCSELRSERLTRMILECALQLQLPKRRPKLLKNPSSGSNLEFDGYNETHQIAFEYDGGGHQNSTHYYHHESITARDSFKKMKAYEHSITLLNITDHSHYRTLAEVILHVLNFVPNRLIKREVLSSDIREYEVTLPHAYKRMRDAAAKAEQSIVDNVFRGSNATYKLNCQNPSHSPYFVPGYRICSHRETWCPECAEKTIAQRLEICKAEVEDRAGIFIDSFGQSLSNLEILYKCKRGHICKQKSYHILSGHECSDCNKETSRIAAYEGLAKLAKEKECVLISSSYEGKNIGHWFGCNFCGEHYTATPHNFRQTRGNSCPNHREKQNFNLKPRNTLENMKATLSKYVESGKGQLERILGDDSYSLKAFYKCKNNHPCSILYSQINRRKTICTKCDLETRRREKERELFQKLNIKRVGSYFGWNLKTTYRCLGCERLLFTSPRCFSVKQKVCCRKLPDFARH